jgi:hypothetical protein
MNESCALLYFAQANAVKCVRPDSREMRFVQRRRIPDCLPLAFEEAVELEPDFIILQSPAMEDVFYDLLRERGEVTDLDEFTAKVLWNVSRKESVVLTVNHPSSYRFKGPWAATWSRYVVPKLAVVCKLLANDTGYKH